MSGKINPTMLNNLVEKMARSSSVFGATLCVESGDKTISWCGAAGNMQPTDRYFIASVTKLYVSAVVWRLVEEGRLCLDDKICFYLPESLTQGLHVLKGIEYFRQITVRHLISNTSGIPDYFFHKLPNGKTAAHFLLEGNDEAWPLEKSIEYVKKMKPNFIPGQKGKVNYSDTNYQLLGRIIEVVTGKPIGEVFKEFIFDPLGLINTYAYSDIKDESPAKFFYGKRELWLPKYIASIAVEGGIVSTAQECMTFLKAYFNGDLFPKERIAKQKEWNLLFGPGIFYFGIGLEKLFIPRIMTPLKPIGEVLGFWGQTGSFAFHNPKTDLFFTGTTNQINGAGHRAAGSALNRIIWAIK